MKVFRPWAFQGSLSRRNYFEGWYFKHVSADQKEVWSFIPGISISSQGRHAFIQVLNGSTAETEVYEFGVQEFSASGQKLNVQIEKSSFTKEGIRLDLQNPSHSIKGELGYSSMEEYPSSTLNPGIMGWYSFVPFMECKHGVVSMLHGLSGGLSINDSYVDFNGGKGYIEKDWGRSFPESWVWLHCNTFNSSQASFTFSVAKIPWLGNYFIGFISYLKYEDGLINLSTWSKAKIEKLEYSDQKLHISIRNRKVRLEIEAWNKQAGLLKAPKLGSMSRIIKESVDANLELRLSDASGNTLFHDKGSRAGMELIDPILEYF